MKMEDDKAAESSAALLDPSVDIFVVFGGGYVELNSGGSLKKSRMTLHPSD